MKGDGEEEEEEEEEEIAEEEGEEDENVNFPNIVRTLSSPTVGRRVRSELWNFTLGDVSSNSDQQQPYSSNGNSSQQAINTSSRTAHVS